MEEIKKYNYYYYVSKIIIFLEIKKLGKKLAPCKSISSEEKRRREMEEIKKYNYYF